MIWKKYCIVYLNINESNPLFSPYQISHIPKLSPLVGSFVINLKVF